MAARSLIATLLVVLGSVFTVYSNELGRVAALEHLEINEKVTGDVVVLGGDVHLTDQAEVEGDVIVLLGRVERDPGAVVSGRVLAVTSLASLQLDRQAGTGAVLLDAAVRILSSGGWLLVTTALAFVLPARLRSGGRITLQLGLKTPLLGLAAWLTLFVGLVAMLGLGPGFGPPLAAALMIVFFALKALGLTVLGGVIGQAVLELRGGRRWPLTYAVFAGVAILLLLRVIPLVGGVLWMVASVIALGLGVMTLAMAEPTPTVDVGVRQASS